MHEPYLCPVCKENRTDFQLVYKLGQRVRKDPHTGAVVFADDEWEAVMVRGTLDLDVTCLRCDYTGAEQRFVEAARRDARRSERIG